jgi:hypothetical protein
LQLLAFEGTVSLRDKDNKVKFSKTLCIPGFARNLVSLQLLLSKGCEVISADEKLVVIRHTSGTEIPFMKNASDNLYYLWAKRDESSTDSGPVCALLAESGIVAIDINEAHRLIDHCDEARVQAFEKQHDWKMTGDSRPCDACIQVKARANAVAKTTTTRAGTNGESRFMGISSPYAASAGKNKY